jgi:hypothetical protein
MCGGREEGMMVSVEDVKTDFKQAVGWRVRRAGAKRTDVDSKEGRQPSPSPSDSRCEGIMRDSVTCWEQSNRAR